MTENCTYCGREIKEHMPSLIGMRDGEQYQLHPACRESYLRSPNK